MNPMDMVRPQSWPDLFPTPVHPPVPTPVASTPFLDMY
jgi:hypothetical protein